VYGREGAGKGEGAASERGLRREEDGERTEKVEFRRGSTRRRVLPSEAIRTR
jgi:hypothetical protein